MKFSLNNMRWLSIPSIIRKKLLHKQVNANNNSIKALKKKLFNKIFLIFVQLRFQHSSQDLVKLAPALCSKFCVDYQMQYLSFISCTKSDQHSVALYRLSWVSLVFFCFSFQRPKWQIMKFDFRISKCINISFNQSTKCWKAPRFLWQWVQCCSPR
jgi:uncharacterized membrane protein